MNGISDRKLEKLRDKRYRDAYVASNIRIGIPYQIRALREQEERKWSQGELGKRAGKPRNVISRLENPEYGQLTIRTLLELASAFDVALLVKYVSYSRFLNEFEDVSPQALEVPSFTCDPGLAETPQPSTNILNAVIGATQPGLAVNVTDVRFHFHPPSGNVRWTDPRLYWTDYRSKGKTLAGKIYYADEDYPIQRCVVSQDYSDKTLIGGLT